MDWRIAMECPDRNLLSQAYFMVLDHRGINLMPEGLGILSTALTRDQ